MKLKRALLIIFISFTFNIIYSLDYTIPPNTCSIKSGDIDNDGDNDIVVGHTYQWGCISFLENTGNGEFVLTDTLCPYGSNLIHGIINLDDDITPDIVFDGQNDNSQLIFIIFNSDISSLFSYSLNISAPVHPLLFGDFDGDSDYDLVFSSYGSGYDNLWGVMYNLGDREFSDPEWFECPSQASNAGFYELECRDLDNNGCDDIIAYTNPETHIYYSDGSYFERDSLNCYAPNGTMVSDDMDNDNDYDIVVSHLFGGSNKFKFYENIGNYQFEYHEQIIDEGFAKAYPCNINQDQYPDIVNIFGGAGFRIYYNTGNFEFYTELIYLTSYGELWTKPTFSDFDGNGTEDIAFIRYGIEENNLTILYNDGDGNFIEEPVSAENYGLSITNYQLTNFPNPFNPAVAERSPGTTISYDLPVNIENPVVEIFNIKGEKIRSLCVFPNVSLGTSSVVWDGTDQYRNPVSSGVYLYRIKGDDFVSKPKKMILLR